MRRRPRAPGRAPLLAAVLLAVLAGGFLLLRDAPMFAIERVSVRGASGPDAPEIRRALSAAAREMTTLHVDGGALRDAVARHPLVEDVEVDRDLPDAIRLHIRERETIATVTVNGRRAPMTADGEVVDGATAPADLPVLAGARGRERLLDMLRAAPTPLRRRARRAWVGESGLTLAMRDGPTVRFGRGDRLEAKWAAAARVLADPATEGARYVDVQVPERPAAGGLVPSTSGQGSAAPADPDAQVEVQG